MNRKNEVRSVSNYEIRAQAEDNKVVVEGYLVKFDSPTELFTGFFEKVNRSAFDETLADGHNIFLLYHHDWSKPLANTKTGTLTLKADNVGLRFVATINDSVSFTKDAIEMIKQGLIEGCSFGFRCVLEGIEYDHETDVLTRELLKLTLVEGSILCIPAYKDTEVFVRCEEIKESEKRKMQDSKKLAELRIELELIEIENAIF